MHIFNRWQSRNFNMICFFGLYGDLPTGPITVNMFYLQPVTGHSHRTLDGLQVRAGPTSTRITSSVRRSSKHVQNTNCLSFSPLSTSNLTKVVSMIIYRWGVLSVGDVLWNSIAWWPGVCMSLIPSALLNSPLFLGVISFPYHIKDTVLDGDIPINIFIYKCLTSWLSMHTTLLSLSDIQRNCRWCLVRCPALRQHNSAPDIPKSGHCETSLCDGQLDRTLWIRHHLHGFACR